MSQTIQVKIRVPEEVHEQLAQRADSAMRTISQEVRLAIREHLSGNSRPE